VLVVDASVAVWACMSDAPLDELDADLVAPPVMWSEARSALHTLASRGDLPADHAAQAHDRLITAPVRVRRHRRLGPEAWSVADELGWARTYDAEYVALARLLDCRVVTADERLRRGADRLGFVVTVQEL
jgi:predicted nucleic acid-binding protein